MNNRLYSKIFYILLAFGVTVNICSYIKFKQFTNTWDYYLQLLGLLLLGIYQIAIHKNRPKIIGISGIIIDVIQIAICLYFKIWGLAITYMFGVITEFYLAIKGKNNYIDKNSIKHYIIQMLLILVISCGFYWYFRDSSINWWKMSFDLISTVLIPVAYYLQAKQSKAQFVFWVTSDVTGLVPISISGDQYSIIAFIFYIIFDTLNGIKWIYFSNENNDEFKNKY